jgi:predicted dehydrogenase
MAIMGMQAGKHVYVEKPCAHNPAETEMLIKAWKRYGKVCQMGNQQRSSRTSGMAVRDIREGVIGDVYHGKAWYANDRGSIGRGKVVPVPDTLDWELWQGPAPREAYRDNVHPYNWHWFRTWGTGEIHNNGTHEIDVCRWALGVQLPDRVTSTGGRYHFTDDDWEYFDTQIASYEFAGGKMITWEGRSCNAFKPEGKGRGATIHGTKGSILLDRENYVLYDLGGKVIRHEKEDAQYASQDTSDTTGFDGLTVNHMQNFVNAIVRDEKQNSDIGDASISTMLCHYGNIALDVQRSLTIDRETGRILNDSEAMSHWQREYAQGWEPTV